MTFLFCDLKDFAAYAETSGDVAAISAIDRFFDAIARERGESGRLVKSLGDGAMLVYGDPAEAVAAGARVIAAMRAPGLPGVHASVHRDRDRAVGRLLRRLGQPRCQAARLRPAR